MDALTVLIIPNGLRFVLIISRDNRVFDVCCQWYIFYEGLGFVHQNVSFKKVEQYLDFRAIIRVISAFPTVLPRILLAYRQKKKFLKTSRLM